MRDIAVRFVLGGALVAAIPLIARQFGPSIGGVMLMFPAITLAGFIAIGADRGAPAVAAAAGGAVTGLIAVAAFLIVVHGVAEHVPVPVSLATGLAAWLFAAGSGGYMATMLAAAVVAARAVIVGRRSEPVAEDQEEGSAT